MSDESRQGLGSQQGSEGCKLRTQLDWTSVAVWSLEQPPAFSSVLGSHLTQLHIALVEPCLLYPVSHRANCLTAPVRYCYKAEVKVRASV